MNAGRFRIFRRRMDRDVRAWPLLVLLLAVVLTGAGCVQWFMREAIRNERLAVREKLAEAYRGQLELIVKRVEERWQDWLGQLDDAEPGAAQFASIVGRKLAASALCFDGEGRVIYPRAARVPDAETARPGEELQAELRRLVKAGDKDAAVAFVLEKFADPQSAMLDAQGRLVAASAELLALELLADKRDPRFAQIAERLRRRVLAYDATPLPSSQRVFVMHELQRLLPGTEFPTLAAEELAASFLELQPEPQFPLLTASDLAARFFDTRREPPFDQPLAPAHMRDLWAIRSPSRRVVALQFTTGLHSRLEAMIRDTAPPSDVMITAVAPGEDPGFRSALAIAPLGARLPGWRLAIFLQSRDLFDNAANERVTRYLVVGALVTAAMSVLAILIARSFGRQMQLTRLKNDLVANVSHELKTPLSAMRALVDTLLDAARFDEKTTREYLQLLSTENARLSRLIDNFLTFSRLERNKFHFRFESLRPESVAEEAVAALGERAHAPGCTFETHAAAGLPAIRGDRDALVTALLNLLDNALKYSGDEKRIVLRTEARNGSVQFSVQDNGIGLSPRESRAVFDRFHQADNRLSRTTSGCGLGLSIVRSIVLAHGGRVEVASEPGRGSTFTIEIPKA